MITNEQRLATLQKVKPEIADLYSSIETARTLSELTKKYSLQKAGEHIDIIGDVILGFYPKEKLATLLVEQADISSETAAKITRDLQEFLAPLPAEPTLPEADSDVPERLRLRPELQQNTDHTKENIQTTGAQPMTRDELMNALTPKRTMQDDIRRAQDEHPDEKKSVS